MSGVAVAIGASAVIGAVAGNQPKKSSTSINAGTAGNDERFATRTITNQFSSLNNLVKQGPGASDVTAGLESQRGLADLLKQMTANGGAPSTEDLASANQFSQDIFAPERQSITSGFAEQAQRTAQLAARLGRPVNDPILQSRLAQEQTRQIGGLEARQTAFRAEEARNTSNRRLQLQAGLADVQGGLATQAFQNRQSLLGLGQSIQAAERNFRLGTATQNTTGGGGSGEAISGGFAGAGAGASLMGSFGGFSTGSVSGFDANTFEKARRTG